MGVTEIWTLIGVNSALLGITSFFVKQWINNVKEGNNKNSDDLDKHKTNTEKHIMNIQSELGKRKGETELLRKDLELLSSETRKSFEGVNIHMNYQKTTLDEIKNTINVKGQAEVGAITELVRILGRKEKD